MTARNRLLPNGVRRTAAILFAVLVLPVATLMAHTVQPMRFELRPSGSEAQTTLTVDNTRSFPITLEVFAYQVALDDDAAEVLTPADDDFLIFPPQMLIDAGKMQSIRVQYIGDPDIKQSKTYRVVVSQIPVDMSGQQEPGVAVAVNFSTLANVVPLGAKPDIALRGAAPGPDGALAVTIENEGAAYARLLASRWTLTNGSRTQTFEGDVVNDWLAGASNLILPGAKREVTVPLPDGFDAAGTDVSIELL